MINPWLQAVVPYSVNSAGRNYAFLLNFEDRSKKEYIHGLDINHLTNLDRFVYPRIQPGRIYDWKISGSVDSNLAYMAENMQDVGLVLRCTWQPGKWILLTDGLLLRRSVLGYGSPINTPQTNKVTTI